MARSWRPSPRQVALLRWLAERGRASGPAVRRAGFTMHTLHSLWDRGLVAHDLDVGLWRCTPAGASRAAAPLSTDDRVADESR